MPNRNSLYLTKALIDGTFCKFGTKYKTEVGDFATAFVKDENGKTFIIRGEITEIFEQECYPGF